MACLQLPIPVFPTLPTGITIPIPPFPPLPIPPLGAEFCCKLALVIVIPVPTLGPLVLGIPGAAAVIAVLTAISDALDAYIDAIPLSCPFE